MLKNVRNFLRKFLTFSFTAIMGIIAGRTLGNLSEDLDLLSWLVGEKKNTQGVTPKLYEVARERIYSQFAKQFNKLHVDSCIDELNKMMGSSCDDKMRKILIRGWLAHMATRTKMDSRAHYIVKKGRKAGS